ncbi:MAG: AraC family transcriptional regulator [Pseudomonadota bacterium]
MNGRSSGAALLIAAVCLFGSLASAQEPGAGADAAISPPAADAPLKAIDQEVQDLKSEVLALNRDLFILEEELLFPANTQVTVFLSFDVGTYFALDGVELEVDGKQVASHLYTQREVDALVRGGVQKLFVGNLRAGEHELVARFTGKGPHGRDYRRGTTLEFEKGLGTRYVELQIHDSERKQQPEFVARVWE